MKQVDESLMERAFALVKPESHWKDRIEVVLSLGEIVGAGVTPADIADAVEFYTGTSVGLTWTPDGDAVKVTAIGYQTGPCGAR